MSPDDPSITGPDRAAASDELDAVGWIPLLVQQIRDFAIFMITPDGRLASWNPGVERVLGYAADEFLGQPAEMIFPPEAVARGVAAAELATARSEGRADNDRWMLRKGGVRFWASGVTTRLQDPGGRIVGFGKVLRDLTADRLLQERIESSERRLRLALSAARVGTWRLDLRTRTDTIDASLARLLGLGDRDMDVPPEDFFAAVYPEDRERTRAAFAEAIRTHGALQIEFRIVGPDGEIRWLRDHGEVVDDEEGVPRYLTGAAVDITEQRLADDRLRQSQRMDAVGKLAGGVAHEVNNMMSVVLGYTDLLLAELAPGDRRRRDLEQVRTAAGRAAEVTAHLLAFSRRQLLRPTALDLGELIDSLRPVLRRLLGEDKELIIHADGSRSHVLADHGKIEQVLVNLALNASDAMGQGDRFIVDVTDVFVDDAFVSAHPAIQIEPGAYVLLTVSDTGHGMDAATLEQVFEPFFTTKATGQGTGLGLAVVHGIVRQSGGDILVESEIGRGTTFRVFLPAVTETGAPRSREPASAALPGHGRTVLVVEDEAMVRRFVVRTLGQRGYRCVEAGDGVEALRWIESGAPPVDAVVTDLVMPRMNGRELAERLAELRPGLPVIFMSGYTDDEMMRRDLLVRGAPFLQKPFSPDALVARLRELMADEASAGPG